MCVLYERMLYEACYIKWENQQWCLCSPIERILHPSMYQPPLVQLPLNCWPLIQECQQLSPPWMRHSETIAKIAKVQIIDENLLSYSWQLLGEKLFHAVLSIPHVEFPSVLWKLDGQKLQYPHFAHYLDIINLNKKNCRFSSSLVFVYNVSNLALSDSHLVCVN